MVLLTRGEAGRGKLGIRADAQIDPDEVSAPQHKAYVSYCTSSCLREGESRLFGAATALAF
jgi:hypothetical protein